MSPYLKGWPQKGKKMEVKCYREVSDALARRLEPLREAQFPGAVKSEQVWAVSIKCVRQI